MLGLVPNYLLFVLTITSQTINKVCLQHHIKYFFREFNIIIFFTYIVIAVLLKQLEKLEDAGKLQNQSSSSSKNVSAKDIVSGVISAANRKIIRSQNKVSSSSKKDSVGSSENSKSNQKLDTIDSNNHKVCIIITPPY